MVDGLTKRGNVMSDPEVGNVRERIEWEVVEKSEEEPTRFLIFKAVGNPNPIFFEKELNNLGDTAPEEVECAGVYEVSGELHWLKEKGIGPNMGIGVPDKFWGVTARDIYDPKYRPKKVKEICRC